MVVPTLKELKLKPEDLIITKTDLKGRITYCNDTFMEFSGYAEEELLGQTHNVIRHPDMPKSVFRLMWAHLQEENEFFGIIKNMRKKGGFYWVFAHVAPVFDLDDQLIGYMSARRYPKPEAVDVFQGLYQRMTEVESQYSDSEESMDASSQLLQELVAEKGGYDEYICDYYK